MPKVVSPGKCRLCGKLINKSGMTSHLKTCLKREAATPGRTGKATPSFHLVIEGRYDPAYWLHLQAGADATFGDLDRVLRDIWLECCGHMSAFRFPRKATRLPMWGDYEAEMAAEKRLMKDPLGKRLQPGVKLDYEYDFGSTTHLSLRVVAENIHSPIASGIRLLARNEAPAYPCAECGKPATQVCCVCDGGVPLCDKCGKTHACGEDMLLPLVNSPRAGVCGYCGPSIEP
jgi:hypothetical protein